MAKSGEIATAKLAPPKTATTRSGTPWEQALSDAHEPTYLAEIAAVLALLPPPRPRSRPGCGTGGRGFSSPRQVPHGHRCGHCSGHDSPAVETPTSARASTAWSSSPPITKS